MCGRESEANTQQTPTIQTVILCVGISLHYTTRTLTETAMNPELTLVIGKVSHHSIELSWMNDENKPGNGPPERWTRFSVEQMDPETHTYSTVYIGYSTHHVVKDLESSTCYSFRLRVTRASGECSLSPVISIFTTREPFSGKNLHQAVNREDAEELTTVLQSGTVDVDVYDKMGFTPLMVAAQKGFTSLMDILVNHGADINKRDSTGKDSLMHACYAGHLDTVKYLRDCGSTWQSQDTDGCTPLHWAVDGGHLAVITYMIQDGCEVDVMDKVSLWTPLMRVSAISGNAAVASILLRSGADVNVRDKAGKTPLMVAVLNNHVELVKLLLDSGADHHMKNEYGAGAADMAKAFGRQSIINLLDNISLEDSNRLTSAGQFCYGDKK
ncbi:fibronectin type 3 and ankyrin repeat domains 1-like protein [Labeo rohita]|uniref:Fibronectin type 3 and ankyrin repeat domains 1-like protein n=1 Tax=Labeo rohita TaxID=84645 RepID=A0A498MLL6_LABRO|nr:fibronectin type 3 and ankyrin repeat domains protein 1-like [Labeo rohita]RXN20683.1 fibronectin type 3 and ankyrin repeat domains 1-like protein [Labeo rohita]